MKIVSCGMGTDSIAMLVGMEAEGDRPDKIMFADTGGEMPHTYGYISILNKWLISVGFPELTIVKATGKTIEKDCLDRGKPPAVWFGHKTCSQRWKIQPQEKFLNHDEGAKAEWDAGNKLTKLIGYDLDEVGRAKHYEDKKTVNDYPLIRWGWGREECVKAIASAGLPQPGKSSCFFCPNMRPSEILAMASAYPDLAQRAIDMERNCETKSQMSGLGRNYRWEELIKQGDIEGFERYEYEKANPCGCYNGDDEIPMPGKMNLSLIAKLTADEVVEVQSDMFGD